MLSSRAVLIGVAVIAAASIATLWLRDVKSTASDVRIQVVRRLENPNGAVPVDAVQLASRARLRWTTAEIERQWTRIGSDGRIYRSPAIQGVARDLFAIVATFPPAASDSSALLLWSTDSRLTPEDFARNRRELRALDDPRSIVLRVDNLQSDQRPIQHLFLHLPGDVALGSTLETLAVVERADLTAHGPVGPLRLTIDGEVRDVILAAPTSHVTYQMDRTARFVSFGLHVAATDSVTVRVRQQTSFGQHELFGEQVTGGGWHDFTVPVANDVGSIISFEAAGPAATQTVPWSTPLLLAAETDGAKPNVVLYVVDALRADALGLYGSTENHTPVLDALAREGLVFERAYAATSWTKPSVTTLLTSLYPATHGLGARFYSDPLPPTAPTLAHTLAADGYATAQFSANPFTGTLSNLDRGFDVAVTPTGFGTRSVKGDAPVRAADLHDRAIAWLRQHRDQRAFLYLQPVDTHPPFSVGAGTPRGAYDASLAKLDEEIGRFRQQLATAGLGTNTLFVLTADHGEAFGEHGRNGHGQSVYDEEVRVPLILHWPGRIAPARVAEPVHHVDLTPTLLALTGTTHNSEHFQGHSVWPTNGAARPSPVVVSRFTYPSDTESPTADRTEMHAMVDYPWKLVTVTSDNADRRTELYRLDTDPGERRDLSMSEPARVNTLTAALDRFLGEQARSRIRFYTEHMKGRPPAPRPPARELLDQLRALGYVR